MKLPGFMGDEVLRHVARKPATIRYPAEPVVMPKGFRGKIVFHGETCSGCRLCEKDCPSGAIHMEKVAEKRFQAIFDLDHCIYCAQCVDSCNKDALEATPEFELAALDRKSLRVVFHAPEAPPPAPAASPAPAAEPAKPA